MRKLLLLPLLLLLVACGATDAVDTTDDSAAENSEIATDGKEVADSQPAVGSSETFTPAKTAAEAGDVRERDWSKGAEDPLITIIEYGDFQ